MEPEIEQAAPDAATAPKPKRKWLKGCGIAAVVVLAGLGFWIGPVVYDFFKAGLFDKTSKRKYDGASIDNLKAMHMAMMVYHESEEMFPDSAAWMDAIETRIRTFDMSNKESEKKLVAPQYRDEPGNYGYAMNDLCSRKYKDDIPEPAKTQLIFESSDLTRNAHGDPAKLRPDKSLAISVEGQLLKD